MIIPPLPDAFFLLEEPPFFAPDEVLVSGPATEAAPPVETLVAAIPATEALLAEMPATEAPLPATPAPEHLVAAEPAPAAEPDVALPEAASGPLLAAEPAPEPAPTPAVAATDPAPPPAFDVPPEDAFPSLADLDAILAANAGPPPGPDLAEREALLALLGLDPAIAADPELYDATIAGLHDPDAEQVVADWMNEAGVGDPPPEWPSPVGDWHLG